MNRRCPFLFPLLFAALFFSLSMNAEEYVAIYDEADVPAYDMPDPLVFENGEKVSSAADWEKRRAEIMALFEKHVYGKTVLGRPEGMRFETTKGPIPFLGGKA